MAFSAQEGKGFFKDWLEHFAKPQGFKTFLDVGCGAGLYGKIIRDVFGKDAKVFGLDIFKEYISRHNLGEIYDEIYINDIRLIYKSVTYRDMIICGDVLEHLSKADAIKIVAELKKKCRFLWAALPVKMGRPWSTGYVQPDHEYVENPANKHLHDWTGEEIIQEFKPLWLVPYVQTGVFLIEGEGRAVEGVEVKEEEKAVAVELDPMTKVAENILIGNSSQAEDVSTLKNEGVTAVLNVAHDLNRPWADGLLSLKAGLTDGVCTDNKVALAVAVMTLRRVLAAGYRVFVHCHDGKNRSPFVVSVYLAEEKGSEWGEEFDEIKKLRPAVCVKEWMGEALK